jgi:ribonucleotide reductase alpha subunit
MSQYVNKISSEFVNQYAARTPPWGPIGYIVYKRTYARPVAGENRTEEWWETVHRCCNGILSLGGKFTQQEIEILYDKVFNLKCCFSGRALWQLGTRTVEKIGGDSLMNCWGTAVNDPIKIFCFVFDELMLGGGVGFNIQREFVYEMPRVKHAVDVVRRDEKDVDFIVPDNREGWVELLRRVLQAFYVTGKSFHYSTICVRGKGTPIRSFGGTASGPEDLCNGIEEICKILTSRVGKKLRPIDCLDVMNIIGSIVIAGNVRRSAQIALGDMDDWQYLDAKNWGKGDVPNWRAMSNNSVICNDFEHLPSKFWSGYNGEGEAYGLVHLKNCQTHGRMKDGKGYRPDKDVVSVNPCLVGDTLVSVADGRGHVSIRQLADDGEDVPVFCMDSSGKLAVRYMRNPRVTGRNMPVYKITLENGHILRTTSSHKFMTTGLEYKTVNDLEVGDGLRMLTRYDARNTYVLGNQEIKNIHMLTSEFVGLNKKERYMKTNNDIRRHAIKLTQDIGRVFGPEEWKNYAKKNQLPQECPKWRQDHLGGMSGLSKWAAIQLGFNSVLQTGNLDRKTMDSYLKLIREGYDCEIVDKQIRIKKTCEVCGKPFFVLPSIREAGLCSWYCKSRQFYNNKINNDKNTSFKHRIISIEHDGQEDVYNGTVDEFHNFFVGGFNETTRNNKRKILYVNNLQCGELPLSNMESCNLAEIFLPNLKDEAEFKEVAGLCCMVTKTISCLQFSHEETQLIASKNYRLGVGVTGFLQEHGLRDEQVFDNVYHHVEEVDRRYSEVLGVKPSIKLTTCKPSGTLSLLPNVTPGVHPAYAPYYIRRVQMASNDPLVGRCRQSGYHIEPVINLDGSYNRNTMVVSFPMKAPEGAICAKDVTAVQQMEWAKWIQRNWSDNSVSVTVYYKKEELPEIQAWLTQNYDKHIKTISFLLHKDHGFAQAPYEEISEEKYKELSKKATPITSLCQDGGGHELQSNLECSKGTCPVK